MKHIQVVGRRLTGNRRWETGRGGVKGNRKSEIGDRKPEAKFNGVKA
ncbi:hypothetical protein [Alkalitalea saponilacus]|nr:hypothetical protein [Alkalitalea saponilacus]